MDWFKRKKVEESSPKFCIHLFGDENSVVWMDCIPRIDEYISYQEQMLKVTNVIYMLEGNYTILMVEYVTNKQTENNSNI